MSEHFYGEWGFLEGDFFMPSVTISAERIKGQGYANAECCL